MQEPVSQLKHAVSALISTAHTVLCPFVIHKRVACAKVAGCPTLECWAQGLKRGVWHEALGDVGGTQTRFVIRLPKCAVVGGVGPCAHAACCVDSVGPYPGELDPQQRKNTQRVHQGKQHTLCCWEKHRGADRRASLYCGKS